MRSFSITSFLMTIIPAAISIFTGSFDRGNSWPVKRLIYEGPSAYSSLAAGKDGTIYVLFERGENKLYESVAAARFNLEWLKEGSK